jgi:hypothetical protein
MSEPVGAGAPGTGEVWMARAARMSRVWRALGRERRLAAIAAFGLLFALFLPWYQETVLTVRRATSTSLTGWGSFSLAEAILVLIAAGVLGLLFERAERPAGAGAGADGWILTTAGGAACLLVVWRILDQQGAQVRGLSAAASGVQWGIFVALAAAGLLAYAGTRIRAGAAPASERRRRERPGARPPGRTHPASRRPSAAATTAIFEVPEPPADPPSLRIRRAEGSADGQPQMAGEPPTQSTDEQLTIPFEEPGR